MRNLIFALLSVATCVALAQEMPAPPKEMDIFKPMIGKWKGKMSWDMEGQKTDFTMVMENVWDGQFVRSHNTMDMGGMKMTETMMFGWDPEKGKYKSWSFTNWAPTPRIEWGTVQGNQQVWISEPWDAGMGEKTESRSTITRKDAKTCEFLLEFKTDGKFAKVMWGTLTKQD